MFPRETCICYRDFAIISAMKKPPQLRGIYKNGRYYWFSRMITGKRNCVSLETEDLSEAIRRAQDLRDHPILESGDLLVHAVVRYVRECVQSGDWSLATERSKGYFICKWAKEMGARLTPRQVTTEDLKRWHTKRRDKVAESTAFGNLMTIQGFFHWAKEARLCASNPVLALTNRKSNSRIRPPAPAARKDFCIPALRDKLIAEAPRQDLAFILHCGFHAGLRFNEIVEAKGFWFDLDGGHLHLRKHAGIRFKDREERTIPLTAQFRDFLIEYGMPDNPNDYMLHPDIPTRTGRKGNIYRWDFGYPFEKYMSEQGCPWVTPHIMRHTFASLLASAGVSIFKVAKWLGDDVRVAERHYAKLLPNDPEIEKAFQLPPSRNQHPLRKPAATLQGNRRSQIA
jgi:integrase